MYGITEPVTLVTDYMLGIASLFFAYKLSILQSTNQTIFLYLWVSTFILLALSSFVGGTYHGFKVLLGVRLAIRLWIATLYIATCTSLALLVAGIYSTTNGAFLKVFLLSTALIKFVSVIIILKNMSLFHFVIYDYALTMAILVLLFGFLTPTQIAMPMIGGIMVSLLASAIQLFKVALSTLTIMTYFT